MHITNIIIIMTNDILNAFNNLLRYDITISNNCSCDLNTFFEDNSIINIQYIITIHKDSFITKEQLFYTCLYNKLSIIIIDKDFNKYTFIKGNWSKIEYKDFIITFEYDENNNLIKRYKNEKNK